MAEKEKKQGRVIKFFKDLKSERTKITWPSKHETLKKTAVVIVELIAVALVVGLLDLGFSKIVLLLADVF
ncbi:MAG: preprotein translocase subunit SecE [Clostridia bacterium]